MNQAVFQSFLAPELSPDGRQLVFAAIGGPNLWGPWQNYCTREGLGPGGPLLFQLEQCLGYESLVNGSLQVLYDAMPDEEQQILETLLQLASDGLDVRGYSIPCRFFSLTLSGGRGETSPVALPPMRVTALP